MRESDKHELKSESALKRYCVVESFSSPENPVCHLSVQKKNIKTHKQMSCCILLPGHQGPAASAA